MLAGQISEGVVNVNNKHVSSTEPIKKMSNGNKNGTNRRALLVLLHISVELAPWTHVNLHIVQAVEPPNLEQKRAQDVNRPWRPAAHKSDDSFSPTASPSCARLDGVGDKQEANDSAPDLELRGRDGHSAFTPRRKTKLLIGTTACS